MINPHHGYIAGFTTSILVYQMGWSKIYPHLSWVLIIFLLATFLIHFILGKIWNKKDVPDVISNDHLNPVYITIFIFLLWTAEFVYGGVPVMEILLQRNFDYRLFGIPSLHVFVVTFASFYTIFLFQLFVTSKKKLYLILFVANLLPSLLIYNRGMMIFNLTSAGFIYIHNQREKISFKVILIALCGVVAFLYLFGVMGNFRQVANLKRGYNSDLFLEIGQPTDRFMNSFVPKEFMWSYIYISSPLANLQTNIEHKPQDSLDNASLQYINNEMLPDFISKRINKLFHWERIDEYTIPGPFNVSTVYSRSFRYLGWAGLIIMALFVAVFPWIYWWLLPKNEYALTAVAILASMYLFLVFDNTIRFTGFCFQLVYPIVYPLIEKRLIGLKSFR